MAEALRNLDTEEYIIVHDSHCFKQEDILLFKDIFHKYTATKIVEGEYSDMVWYGDMSIAKIGLRFYFDEVSYEKNLKPLLDMSAPEMADVLRCYAISKFGNMVFKSIRKRLSAIESFLSGFGEKIYVVSAEIKVTILEFLVFAGISDEAVDNIADRIKPRPVPRSKQRQLADLINYLAVDNELTDMYNNDISKSEFIKWFPLLFWVKITFLLPLRATEMLVTPFDCLHRDTDGIWLTVRRTMLKKGGRSVCYDVDRDYKLFTYKIPDMAIVEAIEKYKEITVSHERRFLFDYSNLNANDILSLSSFNSLLENFITTRLKGNHKYDYARYAAGIKEFDVVTAGDSRPIAMANLYYQDVGSDICRQLADHIHITTSAGYYTNVSNTIYASSIMRLQKDFNSMQHDAVNKIKKHMEFESKHKGIFNLADKCCMSPKKPHTTGDISDCIDGGHINECIGCQYFFPPEDDLKKMFHEFENEFCKSAKNVVKCLNRENKNIDLEFDKVMLDAHTRGSRFYITSNELAERSFLKWQRHKNIATNNY